MLEVSDLEVRYGAIRAVRGISLRVGEGELVALIGANGAGKSSAPMCMAGALKAAGGSVRLDGSEISGRAGDGTAQPKAFEGWLGLLQVLDVLLGTTDQEPAALR